MSGEYKIQEDSEGFGAIAAVQKEQMDIKQRFKNNELDIKTKAVQDEFDSLYEEMRKSRIDRDPEGFYTAMNDYTYGGDATKVHRSPTKRLID